MPTIPQKMCDSYVIKDTFSTDFKGKKMEYWYMSQIVTKPSTIAGKSFY